MAKRKASSSPPSSATKMKSSASSANAGGGGGAPAAASATPAPAAVPSFTARITKSDAERFLEASQALDKCLEEALMQQQQQQGGRQEEQNKPNSNNTSAHGGGSNNDSDDGNQKAASKKKQEEEKKQEEVGETGNAPSSPSSTKAPPEGGQHEQEEPLHELIYKAAQECRHPYIVSFLERLSSSSTSTAAASSASAGGTSSDDSKPPPSSAATRPLTDEEIKAGVMLFYDSDKTSKLRHLFRAFGSEDSITSKGALSLFRSVLTALACCVRNHQYHQHGSGDGSSSGSGGSSSKSVIVEGRPSNSPRKSKRAKLSVEDDDGQETHTTKRLSEASASPASQEFLNGGGDNDNDNHRPTESFDSSLATLHSEDAGNNPSSSNNNNSSSSRSQHGISEPVRKEIEDIASNAADELLTYAKSRGGGGKDDDKGEDDDDGTFVIAFGAFGDWYNAQGNSVVRWLELLQLSKWKKYSGAASPCVPRKKSLPSSSTSSMRSSIPPPPELNQQQQSKKQEKPEKQQQQDQSQPQAKQEQPKPEKQPPPPKQQQKKRQKQQKVSAPPQLQPLAPLLPAPPPIPPPPPPQRILAPPFPPPPLPPPPPAPHGPGPDSPASLANEDTPRSDSVISFDFSTSADDFGNSLCINISKDNLSALQDLVVLTGLGQCPASEVCKTLLHVANRRMSHGDLILTLGRDDFQRILPRIIPQHCMERLSTMERACVYDLLLDFFWLYQGSSGVREDEADLKELAVGLCFFCAGNKSAKLATGFELLDEKRRGYLSEHDLFGYLRSYLLALVALSFFAPFSKQQSHNHHRRVISAQRRAAIRAAVESGARWTLGHFLNYLGPASSDKTGMLSFESFAHWYSTGGYNIAPWLELLDLNKVFSLIQDQPSLSTSMAASSPLPLPTFPQSGLQTTARRPPPPRDRMSSLRRHHSSRRSREGDGPPPEILFSFPLAGTRTLIVLKEDAIYVREVVEALGLLSMMPDNLWSLLSKAVQKRRKKSQKKNELAIYVNSNTFVQCLEDICPRSSNKNGRKRSSPSRAPDANHSVVELLSNFFQCFDIDQVDSVALDELMGGLTLLCGGKKSAKLAFAFGIFDTRPGVQKMKKKEDVVHSLSGEDLFLFLRSILIVTFSCCRQSLDMSDDSVSRCIADTANMICNDVMRHQWETKQTDRLNFDEFGQWYNEGGFERAPWLELLDLKKWVLVDDVEAIEKRDPSNPVEGMTAAAAGPGPALSVSSAPSIPPPPPEDALDPSFFDDNGHDIMNMDSFDDKFDDMDMMLMPQPSSERELDPNGLRISKSFSFSSPRHSRSHQHEPSFPGPPALKFHMVTNGEEGGYMMGISKARIDHFRQILESSGITSVSVEDACNAILSKSTRSSNKSNADLKITKDGFDSAMKTIIRWRGGTSAESKRTLSRLLDFVFLAFDTDGTGRSSVIQVACGIMVLCSGKKSEKLELAFETLDKNKRGSLTKKELTKYLQSFLTVLLSVAFTQDLVHDPALDTLTTMNGGICQKSAATLSRAVTSGAEWAANAAFEDVEGRTKGGGTPTISFDDFADWYTAKGFGSIPFLELIDLRKWLLTSD